MSSNLEASAIARFADVGFSYPRASGHTSGILADFSLEIRRGEFFVLAGPSGCGKTTALNLLAGFCRPSGGSCTFNDDSVRKPGSDRVVIFQGDDSLMHWLTAYGNVEFPLRALKVPSADRKERVSWALDIVKLTPHAHKYPKELSGGMKQRIQIARALVIRPDLLLMDEPFAALDAITRAAMHRQLQEIWQSAKQTCFFITHDIAEAVTLASRVGVMSPGPEAKITDIVDVKLPRPRDPTTREFADMLGTVSQALADAHLRNAHPDKGAGGVRDY